VPRWMDRLTDCQLESNSDSDWKNKGEDFVNLGPSRIAHVGSQVSVWPPLQYALLPGTSL